MPPKPRHPRRNTPPPATLPKWVDEQLAVIAAALNRDTRSLDKLRDDLASDPALDDLARIVARDTPQLEETARQADKDAAAWGVTRPRKQARCVLCGRALRTPESVARGTGATCAHYDVTPPTDDYTDTDWGGERDYE